MSAEGSNSGVFSSALLQLLTILTFYANQLGVKEQYPLDYGPNLKKGDTFDIVIVGGGTAGCILANRLSEIDNWKILVLEAGTLPSMDVEVPIFFSHMLNTDEDWGFKTEKEENLCRSMPEKKCTIHGGKMLGGSTGLSNMHYERAYSKYFLDWDTVCYKKAIIHYENIEGFKGKRDPNTILGISGEISINSLNRSYLAHNLIMNSAKTSGYDKDMRNFGEPAMGYSFVNGYVHEGERWHFAKAFFRKVYQRKNLYVAQNALVSRVVTLDPADNRVSGVDVIINGNEFFVKSKYEVVLTCGAVNTAKLLMLSGIGEESVLKKFRIDMRKELPAVGKHYKDQVGVPVFFTLRAPEYRKSTDFADATYHFLKHKTGPFTGINLNNIIGYINTKSYPLAEPNVKIHHYYFERNDPNYMRLIQKYGYIKEVANGLLERNIDSPILIIVPVLMDPISKGEIELLSTNPYTPPKIKGNYLSDPTLNDLGTLVSGARYVQNLTTTSAFLKDGVEIIYPDIPECRNYQTCTDQYWMCYVKNMGMPMSQGVGTVKAGRNFTDCEVSVDEEMLVKGVRHLRVVDGSVLPNCVPGSLEGTVGMLADKVASDIRELWSV